MQDQQQTTGRASALQTILMHPAAGGVLLMLAVVLAMIANNTSLASVYDSLLALPLSIRAGSYALNKPLLLWINDGLMAIFFFLVGLEIKEEAVSGALSSIRQAMLPFAAAIGGMLVPALIYVICNFSDATALRGWAIPAATDIAFAMGVLALLGPRVPSGLRIFLLALAIIDDLGGILIIALFYAGNLSMTSLGLAAIGIGVLIMLNQSGVTRTAPYILAGIFTWVCVLKSGVHATLAGVAVAMAIPLAPLDEHGHSPLARIKHELEPWVVFAILPIFAFANAGLSLAGLGWSSLFAPIPLGIALGLFVGKQVGVLGAAWATVRYGWAQLPEGVDWRQVHGAAILSGIGFTMSLFIGTLAFDDAEHAAAVRIGVLTGSILSAIVGYTVLRFALRPASARMIPPPPV